MFGASDENEMKMRYKFLPHTADIKFQAFGKTENEAFKNAAYALKEIMVKKIKIKEKIKKKIEITGRDKENLLYNFLEEFLFLFETKRFILSSIKKLKIKEKSGTYALDCEAFGDVADNYEISSHVKAITYNQMFVKRERNKYICQVVVDV